MNFLQTLVFVVAAAATAYAYPGDLYYGGALNHGHQHVDYYAHPHYNYDYAVHDLHTGDVKNKWESRDGDVVKGSYSLNEPDGTIRQVDYTADGHNGFNAVVKKIGKAVHPQPVHYYGGAHLVRPAIAVGHLGAASYAHGNNYALNHYGGYHY